MLELLVFWLIISFLFAGRAVGFVLIPFVDLDSLRHVVISGYICGCMSALCWPVASARHRARFLKSLLLFEQGLQLCLRFNHAGLPFASFRTFTADRCPSWLCCCENTLWRRHKVSSLCRLLDRLYFL